MKDKILYLLAFFVLMGAASAQAKVKEYNIICDPDDFKLIYENFEQDIYVPVTVEYDGKTWTDCRMRIRGDGTRDRKKKSLKIKFDGDPFYTGRDVLNLNADIEDRSSIHSYLATRLYNEIGFPCFKDEQIRVYLNGEFLGLYIQVENVDEAFLKARGMDPKGNLYKATVDGCTLADTSEVYVLWEKKTNENTDRSDLARLITALNTCPEDQYYEFAHQHFDYDKMVTIIAMNMLLANGSTYTHNYYMYHDSLNTGKWIMMPWDMDKTFNTYTAFYAYNTSPVEWFHDNRILKRSILDPRVFSDIKEKLKYLTDNYFNEEHLFPIIDSLHDVLLESILRDTTDYIEDTVNGDRHFWEIMLNNDKYYISHRYKDILWQFENYPLTFIAEKTPVTFTTPPVLKWHATHIPNGRNFTYSLFIGRRPYYYGKDDTLITDLKDTTFTVDWKLEDGAKYYWYVWVHDSLPGRSLKTLCFDRRNWFYYKTPSSIPCDIDDEFVLTKEKSPYVADCSINVHENGKLVFSPGAELRLPDSAGINVDGSIIFNSTPDDPAIIRPRLDARYWNLLTINNKDKEVHIQNADFIDGSIQIYSGKLFIDNINMKRSMIREATPSLVRIDSGYAEVTNSEFYIPLGLAQYENGEGVLFVFSNGTVKNCTCQGIADPIQYIKSTSLLIENNELYNSPDDGIDLNDCINATITGNRIFNSKDKGISIGAATFIKYSENMIVTHNVIAGCSIGIAFKNQINSKIINNTFYNNVNSIVYGITTESKQQPNYIINNIVANSGYVNITGIDKDPAPVVKYNLCDNELISGEGNLKGDPGFVAAERNDFRLAKGSPCINAGDPETDQDPDGTRADIGAYFYNMSAYPLVINEINYNSAEDFNTEDWVEFYNPLDEETDISGWYFSDSDDSHKFLFPKGTMVGPKGYLVLCKDTGSFTQLFPDVKNVVGDMGFGLSGGGELIRLFNVNGKLIDAVKYNDKDPWPVEPDGTGPTLQLISPDLDNSLAESWKAYPGHGTPGRINGEDTNVDETRQTVIKVTVMPNPFAESTSFRILPQENNNVNIQIYDLLGNKVDELSKFIYANENNFIYWNAPENSQGMFMYRITFGNQTITGKIISLK